jgi:hypothetical protein
MVKCRKPLAEQLETCLRRIEGHQHDPKSNVERYFRLLMRETEIRKEMKHGRSRDSNKRRK